MSTIDEAEATSSDQAAADSFTNRMINIMSDAAVALLVSIGHQTSLFDVLATLPPASSKEIADAAGLNERYVREWLGGLASAGIVAYEAQSQTYALPTHHTAALTRAGGLNNVAKVAPHIAILGEVEQKIIACFRNGGGLPYSEFPRFHAARAEEARALIDTSLVEDILPLVEGLPDKLRSGVDLADFGCGSGHAINVMAQAFPASRFTGLDFAEPAVAAARVESANLGVPNATFLTQDLTVLDLTDAFDVITVFDAVHDQVQPARVLENIHRALRPGGALLMADIKASSRLEENIEIPWAPLLYTISTMHCMTVSLAGGGTGLGSMWGRQLAVSMLTDAGFRSVDVREIETDPFNNYYIAFK
ncbi:class I SAM-dependent methyltransferase [Mycobacterium sp. URHB0021]|jgi:SAM-dependent methyltransferase